MFIETERKMSFNSFEKMKNELGDKKLSELTNDEIYKYLLLDEELKTVEEHYGDDAKIWFSYDSKLLDEMVYDFHKHIFDYYNNDLFYNNDLHSELNMEGENYEL